MLPAYDLMCMSDIPGTLASLTITLLHNDSATLIAAV
jgi:hypothetical protein